MSQTTKILTAFLVLLAACRPSGDLPVSDEASALDGAWQLAEAEAIGSDGMRYPRHFQESLLLFAGDHYSMNWAGGTTAAPYYAQRFAPTDAEKVARYSSLVVNAGRFEAANGVLTIWPDFALVPEYVGGIGEFDYRLSGDTLDLVWRRIEAADGTPDPYTAAGVRYHYRWKRR
ncbi:MAG: hypothetical protein AB1631_25930 [Acidobacteriota bacterium]